MISREVCADPVDEIPADPAGSAYGSPPRSLAPPSHGQTLRIDPAQLYWAVFECPPLSRWGRAGLRRRRDDEALRYSLEGWIPAPLDEIEARFTPVRPGSTTYVACGIERDRLSALLACEDPESGEAASSIESAHPAQLPAAVLRRIPGGAGDESEPALVNAIAQRLEFRSGRYIGPRTQTLRRRLVVGAVAAALMGSGLITAALFGAAQRTRSVAAEARIAATSIATAALSSAGVEAQRTGDGAGSGATDWGLRLAAEVRASERTRALPSGVAGRSGATTSSALKEDRGSLFIALLERWPEDIPVQLESLHIEQATATLRGQTRSAAEAESLLLALEELRSAATGAPWTVQRRSLGKSGEATGFTAVLAPESNTGKVSP